MTTLLLAGLLMTTTAVDKSNLADVHSIQTRPSASISAPAILMLDSGAARTRSRLLAPEFAPKLPATWTVPSAEWSSPRAARPRSTARRIVGGIVGAFGGFFVGGYTGAAIEGDSCGCDDPGLKGFVIGAPIGAIAGGIFGSILGAHSK